MTEAPAHRIRQRGALGASTLLAAILGWLTLVVVGRSAGPRDFAQFMAIWGAFFAIAGLLGGLQQEVTRSAVTQSTRPAAAGRTAPRVAGGAALASGLAAALVASVLFVWGDALVEQGPGPVLAVLTVSFLSLGAQSLVVGGLAARGNLTGLGGVIAGSAGVRLVAVTLLAVTSTQGPLAWTIAIALGTIVWLPLLSLREVRLAISVRGDAPAVNFLRTALPAMVSALLAGLLATGLPALVRATSESPVSALEGVLLAAVIAVRTPMLLPLSAFQLPLLSHLVGAGENLSTVVRGWLGMVAVLAAVASALAWWIGDDLLALIFGQEYQLSGSTLAAIALGSAGLLALNLTHIALLAARRPGQSLIGWLLAVAVTFAALEADASLTTRLLLALVAGPVCGLALHLVLIARCRASDPGLAD